MYLPSLKLTCQEAFPKRKLILRPQCFGCYVSFREGIKMSWHSGSFWHHGFSGTPIPSVNLRKCFCLFNSPTFAVPVAEDSLPFGICEFLRPSFWSQSSQLHCELGSCKFQQKCIHCGVSHQTWIHALELPSLQQVFAKATRTIHFWKPSLTWPCCPKSIPSKCKSPNLSHLGNASR